MSVDPGRPIWFWALMGLAAVKVIAGVPGLVLPEASAGPQSPFAWWVYLVTVAVYTTFGGVLLLGGRRDPRAVLLGGVFLLAGSMAADRGLARIAVHGPALTAQFAAVLHALAPGAFRPLLVWLFACTFPRDALTGGWRRVAAAGRAVCAAVGIMLFAISLWAAVDVLVAGSSMPDALLRFTAGHPDAYFWLIVTPLTLAGTPLVLLNMRAAGRSDLRRAEVSIAGP
jgi:hypothetical protein